MTIRKTPDGPRYLLRFDDLCSIGDQAQWRRFLPLIERYGLKPILAVIPDNQDPELVFGPPDPDFWEQMRTLEARGATIGLHGYQHLCHAQGKSLIGLGRRSEFAGVAEQWQRWWIQMGLAILREQRLTAKVWVAPRHGFDRRTLGALQSQGILLVSDGWATRPFTWLRMTWLPQQLWAPVEKRSGLWTICIHPATATEEEIQVLDAFLEQFCEQFTSVDGVIEQWPIVPRSLGDRVFHATMLARLWINRLRRERF